MTSVYHRKKQYIKPSWLAINGENEVDINRRYNWDLICFSIEMLYDSDEYRSFAYKYSMLSIFTAKDGTLEDVTYAFYIMVLENHLQSRGDAIVKNLILAANEVLRSRLSRLTKQHFTA